VLRNGEFQCDVCGDPIVAEAVMGKVSTFYIGFIEGELTAHDRSKDCLTAVREACEAEDITLLPETSPVRKAYEKFMNERSKD
jgi:hypothetical protein